MTKQEAAVAKAEAQLKQAVTPQQVINAMNHLAQVRKNYLARR